MLTTKAERMMTTKLLWLTTSFEHHRAQLDIKQTHSAESLGSCSFPKVEFVVKKKDKAEATINHK